MTSQVQWSGQCRSQGLAVLGIGIGLVLAAVGIGVVVLVPARPAIGWIVLAAGLFVGLLAQVFSQLVVLIDERGMQVRWGRWGWPRRQIAWTRVTEVSAIQVDPLRWGGWGYRWLPWARATAAVVRRGPGIRLDLVGGATFVVTVADAVGGAQAGARAASLATRAARS